MPAFAFLLLHLLRSVGCRTLPFRHVVDIAPVALISAVGIDIMFEAVAHITFGDDGVTESIGQEEGLRTSFGRNQFIVDMDCLNRSPVLVVPYAVVTTRPRMREVAFVLLRPFPPVLLIDVAVLIDGFQRLERERALGELARGSRFFRNDADNNLLHDANMRRTERDNDLPETNTLSDFVLHMTSQVKKV